MTLSSHRTVETTFPVAYNGIPSVELGPAVLGYHYDIDLLTVTPSGFTVLKRYINSGTSPNANFVWRSEGSITI